MATRIVRTILLLIISARLFAQNSQSNGKFSQKIEWKSDKNALEYRVEMRPVGGKSEFRTTTDSFIELSLPAGEYEYRVYVYDLLGRQSSVSGWKRFSVIKAAEPEINIPRNSTKSASVDERSGEMSMDVSVGSITPESKVELINERTKERVSGKLQVKAADGSARGEVYSATSVTFPPVESGEWRLKITNPSGLSSESAPITIKKSPTASEIAKANAPIYLEFENQETGQKMRVPLNVRDEGGSQTLGEGTWKVNLTDSDGKLRISPPLNVEGKPTYDEKPKFLSNDTEPTFLPDGRSFEISLDAEKVSADSTVELFDPKTGESVRGELSVHGVKAQFPETREGDWQLKVTNSGGKSDTAGRKVSVGESPANRALREKAEAERLAEQRRIEEEKRRAEEEKRRAEEEKKRLEEEARRKAEPYKCKEIFCMVGGGIDLSPYDGTFFDYRDSSVTFSLNAKAFYLPFRGERHRAGFGLSASLFTMSEKAEFYDSSVLSVLPMLMGVYQFKISERREIYLSADARLGPALMNRKLEYTEDAGIRESPGITTMVYPAAGFGLSLFLVPRKFLALEIGVEFTHIFMDGISTGIIEPKIGAGIRF